MASVVDGTSESSWFLDAVSKLDAVAICKHYQGKPLPDDVRAKAWQVLLGVKDEPLQWDDIFDLPEQILIRKDCQSLVDRLGNEEEDKVSIVCELECVITRHCKESGQHYCTETGWLDVLAPLLALGLSRSLLYHCFQAIYNFYLPRYSPTNSNPYHLLRLLILYHEPELCSLLDTKKITPELYAKLWLQSLFSSDCDLKVIQAVWDVYFQYRDPFLVFYLALVIICYAKDQLVSMKEEPKDVIIEFIKSSPCSLELQDVEDFCELAQYYARRTPQTLIKECKALIFEGGDENDPCLSQALCLPVAISDLISQNKECEVQFFVVDCRPAEQYNNGHLATAFHLDASLMLQEPGAFGTAVQALWAAQKQALAARSAAGGEHACFMGSGREDEDQYLHMAVASLLQRGLKYLSLARGGYLALHKAATLEDGKLSSTLLVDHNPRGCLGCNPGSPTIQPNSTESADEESFFERLASAMRTVRTEVRGKLSDYINNPSFVERHVSSSDKLGKRYREAASVFSIDDESDDKMTNEEEVCIETWIKKEGVLASFKCEELRENNISYPSYLILTRTHLYLLREKAHKRGFANIVARRSLLQLVKITSKKRRPEIIAFKYGNCDDAGNCQVTALDRLYIPQAAEATQMIKSHLLSLFSEK